jgi:hypothetical protein
LLAVPVLLFASLAVAERGLHDRRARALPSDGAEWIWAEGPWEKSAMPAAFLAACDFPLADAPPAAQVSIVADEEYLLYVNGRLVGSNRYRDGARLDLYEVADLLQAGTNRLVVELRSGRGAGGMLAMVAAAGSPVQCASGPQWRIFRRRAAGLLRGWMPLDGGESPRLWGFSPTGRWGEPVAGEPRPRLDGPRLATLDPGRGAQVLAAPGDPRPARLMLFDWGEPVYGFLRLRFARGEPAALLYLGAEPPDPRQRPADALVVGLPGDNMWRSATPVRLRYLLVGGDADLRGVEMLAGSPEIAAAYPSPWVPPGLLGLSPPPLRTPVEDEIRRELQGFAGLARREEP